MSRRLVLVMALAALGCGASAGREPASQPGPAGPQAPSGADSARASKPELAGEHHERLGAGPPAGSDRSPVVAAEPTHCERACAEVHACLLAEGEHDPAAAASIELGCLDACITESERGDLFGCRPPATREPGEVEVCAPFLACVRDAWPAPRGAGEGSPGAPMIVPEGSGCQLACGAFGRCHGFAADEGAIAECVKICERSLEPELERQAGACALLGECSEIISCIEAVPGA